jgi:hypothetical protein
MGIVFGSTKLLLANVRGRRARDHEPTVAVPEEHDVVEVLHPAVTTIWRTSTAYYSPQCAHSGCAATGDPLVASHSA